VLNLRCPRALQACSIPRSIPRAIPWAACRHHWAACRHHRPHFLEPPHLCSTLECTVLSAPPLGTQVAPLGKGIFHRTKGVGRHATQPGSQWHRRCSTIPNFPTHTSGGWRRMTSTPFLSAHMGPGQARPYRPHYHTHNPLPPPSVEGSPCVAHNLDRCKMSYLP
jgi:hypothetical protein